jgi:hypothetical protein
VKMETIMVALGLRRGFTVEKVATLEEEKLW